MLGQTRSKKSGTGNWKASHPAHGKYFKKFYLEVWICSVWSIRRIPEVLSQLGHRDITLRSRYGCGNILLFKIIQRPCMDGSRSAFVFWTIIWSRYRSGVWTSGSASPRYAFQILFEVGIFPVNTDVHPVVCHWLNAYSGELGSHKDPRQRRLSLLHLEEDDCTSSKWRESLNQTPGEGLLKGENLFFGSHLWAFDERDRAFFGKEKRAILKLP